MKHFRFAVNKLAEKMKCAALAAALVLVPIAPARAFDLLSVTITTAGAGVLGTVYQYRPSAGIPGAIPRSASIACKFTYGSGGTSADAYAQTSLDGATWVDVVECGFTTSSATKVANLSSLTPVTTLYTPTDGALAANTAKDGILGPRWRVKYTTVGTYAGGTLLQVSINPGNLER